MTIVLSTADASDVMLDFYLGHYLPLRGYLLANMTLAMDEDRSNELNEYVAMISGSTFSSAMAGGAMQTLAGNSIVDLLEAKGLTWKAYYESYNGGCSFSNSITSPTGNTYSRSTNPFLCFVQINSNPSRCKLLTNETAFADDVASKNLPNWMFYVPAMEKNTLLVGSGIPNFGYKDDQIYTHYSILATIENALA
ncbi:hypothetical protein HDU82_005453 [Entophlyctis luteolus]|nr:hypothetical protein HDU82_005453 [Entophlyctis luteolus]